MIQLCPRRWNPARAPSACRDRAAGPPEEEEVVSQPAKLMRDRLDGQAASRGGSDGSARRREPHAHEGDLPRVNSPASRGHSHPSWPRNSIDSRSPSTTARPPMRSFGVAQGQLVGWLAALPGHSGDAFRPAGGHPAPTRADARSGTVDRPQWPGEPWRGADSVLVS